MTLVVSDISKHGIIMVGDSAVTIKDGISHTKVIAGASKVQYSEKANIGISMWGNAQVGTKRLDSWIADFIQKYIIENDSVEDVGNKLQEKLNQVLSLSKKPWKDMVCGFHIGGFKNDIPVLYHVHCGHDNEPAHELRLYKDYPDNQKWSEKTYEYLLNFSFIHLRNGYHPLFGLLFDNILDYSNGLRLKYNISFPRDNLDSRFDFYKLLVRFVADSLPIAGITPGVNSSLSSIAFTSKGLQINEQLQLLDDGIDETLGMSVYF